MEEFLFVLIRVIRGQINSVTREHSQGILSSVKKANNIIRKMRIAHEKQAAAIRKKPVYDRVSEEMDVEYRVARDLQAARKLKNLTQAELAERMGTTQSVVSRVEKGSNVSIETLARYAAACGARLNIQIA
jgi:ribosome-binding protein aMBF1 (putative translation factor)